MIEVVVRRRFAAPLEQVFRAVTDSAQYPEIPGIVSVRPVRVVDGPYADGVGTEREVTLGLVWFREEIVGMNYPRRMDYRIRESKPAFDHRQGSFEFVAVPGGTEVIWRSQFSVESRLPAALAGRLYGGVVKAAFAATLLVFSRRLGRGKSPAAAL